MKPDAEIDDLHSFLDVLPTQIRESLLQNINLNSLIEVVLDLGRRPQVRFIDHDEEMDLDIISFSELDLLIEKIGRFGNDNRAGVEKTLHRFSAIRARDTTVIGVTCRVGRSVQGTTKAITDLVNEDKSMLLLGRPGVGKTTILRELARVLSVDLAKRVIIVDTSNEIGGDGFIPHPGIGKARRMQVARPELQHDIMIEAVENHMPEVIIIDEMGTELEAKAARTIAERGVQLIATAHGNDLESLLMNPTLSDLVGGVQTVILGDEEARKRGTQKTVTERKLPPTFEIVLEIRNREKMAIHEDVGSIVDNILKSIKPNPEIRWLDSSGEVLKQKEFLLPDIEKQFELPEIQEYDNEFVNYSYQKYAKKTNGHMENGTDIDYTAILPFGISKSTIRQLADFYKTNMKIVENVKDAQIVVTTKSQYRRSPKVITNAELDGTPVHILRKNTVSQISEFIKNIDSYKKVKSSIQEALEDAENAILQIQNGSSSVQLDPQDAYTRKLQHQVLDSNSLVSISYGKEPERYIKVFKKTEKGW